MTADSRASIIMALSKAVGTISQSAFRFRSHTCVHTSQHYLTLDMRQHQSLGVGRVPTVYGLELPYITSVSSIQFSQSPTAPGQSSNACTANAESVRNNGIRVLPFTGQALCQSRTHSLPLLQTEAIESPTPS
jgi:hypothetical protein